MLHFEESYFEGEEREGFFVESKMKHAWAAQMELLKVIEELCAKHGLRYFAFAGTLLGAVRHQGFIPWDDDIDIAMLREEYEKFLGIAKRELPKEYVLLSIYTEEAYSQPFTRLTNGREIRDDREHMERWHGCPYVIGVDIFPLDYISRNEEEESLRKSLMDIVITARGAVKVNAPNMDDILQMVEEYCGVKLDKAKPFDHQLLVLVDRLSQMFSADEADEVACLYYYVIGENAGCPKVSYAAQERMPFETTEIAVPGIPDEVLRSLFGDDYMTPKRILEHDYPFYAEQDQKYQKAVAEQIAKRNAEY